MRDPEIYLAVQKALTEDERKRLLEIVCRNNPMLRGAHVADVLDMADNADAYIAQVEPFYEDHASGFKPDPRLPAAVIAAAILQPNDMLPLVQRILATP